MSLVGKVYFKMFAALGALSDLHVDSTFQTLLCISMCVCVLLNY